MDKDLSALDLIRGNVKYYRNKFNMSQQQLAELCNLSTFYIAEIERGKKTPSLSTIESLAEIFNIPVYLMFIEQSNYKDEILKQFCNELEKDINRVIRDFKSKH